ncbi:MAG: methyltransferase domain-containing protein, partial [Promicromonosporaceae bacterium]|nr:methyltransferase domain-containing protein [Promicromonosporaceae bacterium]
MPIDLTALGYERQGTSRLWAKPKAEAFGYNDGDEFEEWVAGAIREAADVSTQSTELETYVRDWPSLYHLSRRRANLLRPILDTIAGPVLEVGPGMGAITRTLGEAGLEVISIEGSPRRAAICADRCRDLENVQVVADTIQNFGHPQQFQTVLVCGVLEYARSLGFPTDGRDPEDIMLTHLAGLLAPGGQLIIAIENQVGLKYFAGYPEDHLGRRNAGIEDRYGPHTPVTFGRRELGERLSAAGLAHHLWYYPLPDYKLPIAVLADAALHHDGFDPTPILSGADSCDFQKPQVTTFELSRAWGPVARNGLAGELSNSFLVRATREPQQEQPELAWYFGGNLRSPDYVVTTRFLPTDNGIMVHRDRLNPDASATNGPVTMVAADESYTSGPLWSARLAEIVSRDGWSVVEITAWFDRWRTALFEFAGVADTGDGASVLPGNCLDALPRNLILTDERAVFFDLEWAWNEPLTWEFVAFRCLRNSLESLGPVAPSADANRSVGELLQAVAQSHGFCWDDERIQQLWTQDWVFVGIATGRAAPDITAKADLAARLTPAANLDNALAGAKAVNATIATLQGDVGTLLGEIENLRAGVAD